MNKHNIYFVDDEPDILRAVKNTLKEQYFVNCYRNPRQALNEAEQDICDLLITDMNMPDMDGMTLLKEFRKLLPVTPVMILTGYGDVKSAQQAISLGADDFLEKPFDRSDFLDTIDRLLSTYAILKQLAEEYSLSKMQFVMLQHVLAGRGIKESAYLMNRSDRTLESHRYKMMKKMNVANVMDILTQPSVLEYFRLTKQLQMP